MEYTKQCPARDTTSDVSNLIEQYADGLTKLTSSSFEKKVFAMICLHSMLLVCEVRLEPFFSYVWKFLNELSENKTTKMRMEMCDAIGGVYVV